MNDELFHRLLNQADPDGHLRGEQALKRFAQLVAEECAKIADRSTDRHQCTHNIREAFDGPPT